MLEYTTLNNVAANSPALIGYASVTNTSTGSTTFSSLATALPAGELPNSQYITGVQLTSYSTSLGRLNLILPVANLGIDVVSGVDAIFLSYALFADSNGYFYWDCFFGGASTAAYTSEWHSVACG